MDDNPHLHNIVLRPLCPTRWVMRLPAVDAFLAHDASILEFMDELKNDRTEPAKNKEWAESYLRGLETFQNYFCLTDRYSANDLGIVELFRKSLEDSKMSDADLTELVQFYEGDVQFEMLRQDRRNWFALCEGNGVEPTIKILRSNFVEKTALKFLLPNLHMICTIYVCLPVSVCEAERSFNMMRRIHTWLRNSQSQQRLDHCAFLAAHKDITREMDIRPLMEEFIGRTMQRRILFRPKPSI